MMKKSITYIWTKSYNMTHEHMMASNESYRDHFNSGSSEPNPAHEAFWASFKAHYVINIHKSLNAKGSVGFFPFWFTDSPLGDEWIFINSIPKLEKFLREAETRDYSEDDPWEKEVENARAFWSK